MKNHRAMSYRELLSSASMVSDAFALGAASAFASMNDAFVIERTRADTNKNFDLFEAELDEASKALVIDDPELALEIACKSCWETAGECIAHGKTALGVAFTEVTVGVTRTRLAALRERLLAERNA